MEKIEVHVTGDYNDADYTTGVTEFNLFKFEEAKNFTNLIDSLKRVKDKAGTANGVRWGTHDMACGEYDPSVLYKDILTTDEIEWINECMPYAEYGIHTISEVNIYPVATKTKII